MSNKKKVAKRKPAMRKFDLRKHEGQVMTFDHKPAMVLDTGLSGERSVLVKHQNQEGEWTSSQVTPQGCLKKDTPFIIPAPKVGYMNTYRRNDGRIVGGTIYPSADICEKRATENTVRKAVKVPL